jgi:hypothetical protein
LSSLAPEERRVLATMGLIVERNGLDHTQIGGMERPGRSYVSARLLARDWGIFTGEDALERIGWLRARGSRSERAHDRERLLGWDLLRAVAVASWAHHAYLLELDVAWRHMVEISRELQQAYRSWRELGQSYLHGYATQIGDDQELAILRDGTLPRLLSRQDSPWLALPFDLALAPADRPPALAPNELLVDPDGGGDAKTIGDALKLARPGDRVVLSSGTYRERVDIRTPIELVARGAATIEGDDSCCLFVNASSVVASGLRLSAKVSSKNEPMHAVIVHSHLARLVDCDVSAPRFGVYLASDKARVDLVRSTLHDAQVAVFAEGGQLVIEDSSLLGSAAANLQCAGETHARVVRGRIAQSGQAGVCVRRGANAELRGVTLEGNEFGIDVLDGGAAHAEGGRIVGHRGGGARAFGPEARLSLQGITLTDNGAVNVGAVGATAVVAEECTMEGAGAAAWADQGGRILLRSCRVGLGSEGLTREMNEGRVVLEACVAAATHEA